MQVKTGSQMVGVDVIVIKTANVRKPISDVFVHPLLQFKR